MPGAALVYSRRVPEAIPESASAPSLLLALLEAPRALTEASTLLPASALLNRLPCGDGHAVMTLPGFLASDRSTRVLRRYLRQWDYDAHPWALGRTLGLTGKRDLEGLLDRRLEDICSASGGRVSLVGWSLGGLLAREMARRNTHLVRSVITLGSPFGDPRAANAWRAYEFLSGTNIDDADMRLRISRVREPVPGVPITAIYSRSDAIVSWRIASLPPGELVENVGINASHFGMGFNPAVLYVIADRLRQRQSDWTPFSTGGIRSLFFH